MLAEGDAAELQEFCTALHPASTADFMEGLSAEEAWRVLQFAEMSVRAEIFGYFPREKQVEIIELGERTEIAHFIANLPPDDRVDLLNEVEPDLVDQLLPLVPAAERRDILRLRAFPENTAGAVMTTEFARLGENLTVRQALEELGKQAGELETIYYIYILDEEGHLRGLVSARQLVSAMGKPDMRIGDLMEQNIVSVDVGDDQEEVARKVAHYDLLAIPVVDQARHMLGIVTHDDVIDVVVEEATEDAYKMGGMMPMHESYLESGFVTIWRKRAGWLSLLFVAELFTFTALASFDESLKAVSVLALFIPLCISTGGNSGSQAATLITRAIALGQITVRDWFRVLRHELLMGLALGATLGTIGFFRAALTPHYLLGDVSAWQLAFVIAQAVAVICLWGTLTGSLLPIVFKRLGFDPGFASSPFVATFVDVTGIVIFFTIAQAYLLHGRGP
jgi:magnesium transporter